MGSRNSLANMPEVTFFSRREKFFHTESGLKAVKKAQKFAGQRLNIVLGKRALLWTASAKNRLGKKS